MFQCMLMIRLAKVSLRNYAQVMEQKLRDIGYGAI